METVSLAVTVASANIDPFKLPADILAASDRNDGTGKARTPTGALGGSVTQCD